MSKNDVTNSDAFTINPNASAAGLIDAIAAKLAHVDALTGAIYGGGFEAFNSLDEGSKDEYLWAISDLVKEARMLFKTYDSRFFSNRGDPSRAN